VIQNLKARVDERLDQFGNGWVARYIPRAASYYASLKLFIDGSFDRVVDYLKTHGTTDYEQAVEIVMGFLRDGVPVPFYLIPVRSAIMGSIRDYLLAHKSDFVGGLITSGDQPG
jgi:hypothetical protein